MSITIDKKFTMRQKLMCVTPIVSLIFFILLLYFGRQFSIDNMIALCWTPFLLIPLMTIVLGYWKIKFTYPLFVTVAYFSVCLVLSLTIHVHIWHPAWVIFLTIPIFEILVAGNQKKDDVIDV